MTRSRVGTDGGRPGDAALAEEGSEVGEYFDELSRAFARGRSRRRALRRFAAGVLAGTVAVLMPGGAKPAAAIAGSSDCVRLCLQFKGELRQRCLALAPTCPNGCAFIQLQFLCT
jgi:hypothetical protein